MSKQSASRHSVTNHSDLVYALLFSTDYNAEQQRDLHLVKIGLTSNLKRRLDNLNTARETEIKVLVTKEHIDRYTAKLTETELHAKYASAHIRLELFRLTTEQMHELISDLS